MGDLLVCRGPTCELEELLFSLRLRSLLASQALGSLSPYLVSLSISLNLPSHPGKSGKFQVLAHGVWISPLPPLLPSWQRAIDSLNPTEPEQPFPALILDET